MGAEGTGGVDALAVRAWQVRLAAEWEMVAAILADPARGVAVARERGVGPRSAVREDLRLIYLACDVGAGHGQRVVLRLAEELLREEGMWEEHAASRPVGMKWSGKALAAYAEMYLPTYAASSTVGPVMPNIFPINWRH